MDEKDINRLRLIHGHEAEEFPLPFSFKEEILWFFPVQVNLACTAFILKEANTVNEGFSK